MTRTLEYHGSSAEESVGAPFVEHRLVHCLMAYYAPMVGHRVVTTVTSLTGRSDLADLAAASPQASGQCAVFLDFPKPHQQLERPEPARFQSGMLGQTDLRVLSLTTLTHDLGHYPITSGAIVLTSGRCDVFENAYLRILRNTMAHSFPNPREEERSEEAIKANTFLSNLYRLLGEKGEDAAMRFAYGYFYAIRRSPNDRLCNRILSDVNEKKLPPVVLIAMLTITAPLRKRLSRRESFYSRAKKAIADLRGPEVTARLLVGLE